MAYLALTALVAAACNLILTAFILSRGLSGAIRRAYGLWGTGIVLWNLSAFFLFRVADAEHALMWAKMLQLGVIALPATNMHVCFLTAGLEDRRKIFWAYVVTVGFIASLLAGYFISGVRPVSYGYYSIAGPGFYTFGAFYSIVTAYTMARLFLHQRLLPPLRRSRVRRLLAATVMLAICGTHDLLPVVGLLHYPGTDLVIAPIGNWAAIFYGLVIGYSALQFQLLDVTVALGRAASFLVRFGFLLIIGVILQIVVARFAPAGRVDTFTFVTSLAVLMMSTLIASLLFPRLLGGRLENMERRLLGDRFEYQDQVRKFIEGMTWYGDLHSMLNDLHELLTRTFRLTSYQIILRDETSHAFTTLRTPANDAQKQVPHLSNRSPVFRYFEWEHAEYLALNPMLRRSTSSALEKSAREQLEDFSAELCFRLATENDPFGLVLVGPKLHGEPFTSTDITLLVALVKNLSLMVNQIRLKNQILQAQELDLLGRMSRGMAHDLNNLLTPVWTLLHLSAENGNGQLDEELLPVALRNLKTMRAYIKEALFFSENLRPDLQLGRLDLVVRQAADVARDSRKREMVVTAHTPGEVLVEMDEVLMQRLVANLITNAIDASPAGSRVDVHLERLSRTEPGRDWLRIRIVDQGEGIPKENLNRIFTAYFTTKNHGDENRGFGLGLAICRKIVNLHGGNLNISSQLRHGTTVQVDLPSRQPRPAATPAAEPVS